MYSGNNLVESIIIYHKQIQELSKSVGILVLQILTTYGPFKSAVTGVSTAFSKLDTLTQDISLL